MRWCGSSFNYSNIWIVSREIELDWDGEIARVLIHSLIQRMGLIVRSLVHSFICSLCLNKRFVAVTFAWWHTCILRCICTRVCVCVTLFVANSTLRCFAMFAWAELNTKPHVWMEHEVMGFWLNSFRKQFDWAIFPLNSVLLSHIRTNKQAHGHTRRLTGVHSWTLSTFVVYPHYPHTTYIIHIIQTCSQAHKSSNQIIINQEALEMWTPNFGHFRFKLNWCVLWKKNLNGRVWITYFMVCIAIPFVFVCMWLMVE